MREVTCNQCGDPVVIVERGESLVNGESPREHLERTGHAHNAPEMRQCADCDNVWPYTGDADRPTCPNCRGKQTVPAE